MSAHGGGLPAIRLHDLRHTHATLLLAAGVPVKLVSERLGHATATITLGIYAHVMPGMQPRRPPSSRRSSAVLCDRLARCSS